MPDSAADRREVSGHRARQIYAAYNGHAACLSGRGIRKRLMVCGSHQGFLKLMIVYDSNIIRRRIERSHQMLSRGGGCAQHGAVPAVEMVLLTQPDIVTWI